MKFSQKDIDDIRRQANTIIELANYKSMWEEFWRLFDFNANSVNDINELREFKNMLEFKYLER